METFSRNIYFDKETYEILKTISQKQNRSMSAIVREAIQDYNAFVFLIDEFHKENLVKRARQKSAEAKEKENAV